jgi:hypothetical protein
MQQVIADIGTAYAFEWNAAFALRIRAATAFAQIAMRPNAAFLYLSLLKRFPKILTVGARLSGKTKFVAVV